MHPSYYLVEVPSYIVCRVITRSDFAERDRFNDQGEITEIGRDREEREDREDGDPVHERDPCKRRSVDPSFFRRLIERLVELKTKGLSYIGQLALFCKLRLVEYTLAVVRFTKLRIMAEATRSATEPPMILLTTVTASAMSSSACWDTTA